jgi:hypothetical protein
LDACPDTPSTIVGFFFRDADFLSIGGTHPLTAWKIPVGGNITIDRFGNVYAGPTLGYGYPTLGAAIGWWTPWGQAASSEHRPTEQQLDSLLAGGGASWGAVVGMQVNANSADPQQAGLLMSPGFRCGAYCAYRNGADAVGIQDLRSVLSNLLANLFFLSFAAGALFGLVAPERLMQIRSYSGKEVWFAGGALFRTTRRTRVTCAFLLAMALFVFTVQIFFPV